MTMVWRKVAHIVLGCALLIGFQLYGIAGLVQNEPPRGSVFGVAYSERTLAPIPKTYVRLIRQEPLDQPPQGMTDAYSPPDEPTEMYSRAQGWNDQMYAWYECGYAGAPDESTQEICRGLPYPAPEVPSRVRQLGYRTGKSSISTTRPSLSRTLSTSLPSAGYQPTRGSTSNSYPFGAACLKTPLLTFTTQTSSVV